jgi:ADP-ribosyl-[dinitrogen reductase] hydrolase
MNLSNTGGGGRGSDQGEIVGSVILHGKKEFWKRGGNFHYHHGMRAGENTLDALVTRLLTNSITKSKKVNVEDFLADYIKFMTTPGSHNDTYANTCHRMFFKNWVDGKPPGQCPDNDGHNVDSIDALVSVPPVALAYSSLSREERNGAIKAAIQATRRTDAVLPFAFIYSDMLLEVLSGKSITEAAQEAGLKLRMNVAESVKRSYSDPMTACYIDSAFPALLYFAYKYGDDYERMLLASANAGGENVARGALLGALAGARFGLSGTPSRLREDLLLHRDIEGESTAFAAAFGFQ